MPHLSRIEVTVEGHGPDVVLLHGLGSSHHVWDAEAAQLRDRYRLHLVQVKGFAGTPAGANATGPVVQPLVDEIDAYVHAAGLVRPAVIGHSLGGLMGLMLAQQHPEDVGKLLIVDALPWYALIYNPQATMASVEPRAAAMRDAIRAETDASFAASAPAGMAMLAKTKGPATDAAIAASASSDRRVFSQAMYEDLVTDLRPKLAGISAPVTVLYAWDAAMPFPAAAADTLYASAYASVPHKRLTRIDDSYHFIQIDQPARFDREVRTFLTE
jgi:pimeloyl-ACP methyl ester carboxylesterase